MSRATKIILFWVLFFCVAAPGPFMDWHWSIGVLCGYGLACLFEWRRSW